MNLKAETQDAPRKAVVPIIFTLFLSDAAAELTYPSLIYRDTKLSLQMEAEAASARIAWLRFDGLRRRSLEMDIGFEEAHGR